MGSSACPANVTSEPTSNRASLAGVSISTSGGAVGFASAATSFAVSARLNRRTSSRPPARNSLPASGSVPLALAPSSTGRELATSAPVLATRARSTPFT